MYTAKLLFLYVFCLLVEHSLRLLQILELCALFSERQENYIVFKYRHRRNFERRNVYMECFNLITYPISENTAYSIKLLIVGKTTA